MATLLISYKIIIIMIVLSSLTTINSSIHTIAITITITSIYDIASTTTVLILSNI